MFSLVRGLIIESKEVGGGGIRRGNVEFCLSKLDRGKFWRDYMEGIVNEEDVLDCDV